MPEEALHQVDKPRSRVLVLSHDPDCAGHVQTVVDHAPAGATVTVVSAVRQNFRSRVRVRVVLVERDHDAVAGHAVAGHALTRTPKSFPKALNVHLCTTP
jgi:hypothetical protein